MSKFNIILTKQMELNPSREANSCSDGEEIQPVPVHATERSFPCSQKAVFALTPHSVPN